MEKSIVKFLEESLRSNWKENALSDLQGETLTYEQLAISVAKLQAFPASARSRLVAWNAAIRWL